MRLFALVLLGLVFTGGLMAQDLGAVRARMSERLAQLDELKAAGSVGENNAGFLEARGGDPSAATKAVITAENEDRNVVYAAIARQAGATAETVARARARQIASTSAPGVWVQGEDGAWVRKSAR